MPNKKIVIFGAGDIAQLAHFYFTNDSDREVAGFVVDDSYVDKPEFCGLPLVSLSAVRTRFPPDEHDAFVALSYAKMNELRAQKCAAMKAAGYRLATYLSSRATCFATQVGENCFILEDNTVQPFVSIGNNVTLWSGNHIGHHSRIDDDTFISSHVVVSGGVHVGRNCFIGVNATIRDHVTIADGTLIGAGALITKSTEPRAVFKGRRSDPEAITSDKLAKI
jgi:sugar O-acyltransferase (sialic acid O-acetyltransferase NeuD family)